MITSSLHVSFYLSWASPGVRTLFVLALTTQGGLPLYFLYTFVTLLSQKVNIPTFHGLFLLECWEGPPISS